MIPISFLQFLTMNINIQDTPFPGKTQTSKSKANPKITEVPKTKAPIHRQRRVFGTIRNPNVQSKTEKSTTTIKPSIGISQKHTKSAQTTRSSTKAVEKKSPEKNRVKPREKSVIFRENVAEIGKSLHTTSSSTSDPIKAVETKSPETSRAKPREKSVIFQENVVETGESGKSAQPTSSSTSDPIKAVENRSPATNRAKSRTKSVIFRENVAEIGGIGKSLPTTTSSSTSDQIKAVEKKSPEKNRTKTRNKSVVLRENVAETGKPLPTTSSSTSDPIKAMEKKSPEKNRAEPRSKRVIFRENVLEKVPDDRDINGPRTPVGSPALIKPRNSSTPFHSVEKCSKCRFDRLETSSYWLSQIKLSESVGKHFVSASLFRLAFQSNAEPIGSLRVELKQYLKRHGHLSTDTEWRDVSLSYGLLVKDEINALRVDSGSGGADKSNASNSVLDEEQKDLENSDESFPIQKN